MFDDIKDTIRELVETDPKGYSSILRFKYPTLVQYLKDTYPSRGEGLYCWLYNINTTPGCKQCGARCSFNSIHNGGYREFCGTSCRAIYHKSYRNAHNIDGHLKQSAREKIKTSSPVSRRKAAATMLDRYGHNNPMLVKSFVDAKAATTIERYGVANVSSIPAIRQKATQTCVELYGDQYPARLDKFKAKVVQTNNDRYGRDHPSQQHLTPSSMSLMSTPDWIIEQHVTNQLTVTEIAGALGVTPTTLLNRMAKMGVPPVRHPTSVFEREIVELLRQHYSGAIETNVRGVLPSNQELDILLPSLNLAIECNGVYWHGEQQGKSKAYHLNKTQACEKLGVRLIHIYDTEWHTKRNIVESRLKNAVGSTGVRIFARNTSVRRISAQAASAFCVTTHIQGAARASVHLGLFDETNQLVSVMTFGSPRYDATAEYELVRFASAVGTNVIGGAGKLFNYFIRSFDPTTVISYSDRRWNTGGVYQRIGMTHASTTPPSYYYYERNNANKLMHRSLFQKHLLPRKLNTFDHSQTEYANMVANGYDRIWDCGTTKWVWTRPVR